MEDKKMKGKLEEYIEEDSQTWGFSSDLTSVEDETEMEISDPDEQSLRNQQYRKITILGPDPKGKRPKYDYSSSSDSKLPDLNSLQDQPKQTSEPIPLPTLPRLESWLEFQDLTKTQTYALTGGISIPGVSSHSRPPRPPRLPRPPAAKPNLELGLRQQADTSSSGSATKTPVPNVGSPSGAAGPSSGQQQSMQQGQFRPPTGALNLPTISPQSLHQLLQPDYITHRMLELENEVKNVKGVADLLLSELSDSNTRILILEDEVRTLKGGNQGLQKSSEGKTATDERNCGSGLAGAKVPFDKSIRSGPGSTSGKDDESQGPVTIAAGDGVSAANPADAKAPSDMRVRSGPCSTSGKDDECHGLVTISSGDGISSANPADAKVPSDIRVSNGPGSSSGKDDESQEPVTIASGDGVSAANTDRNKATTGSDGSQDEKKDDTTSQVEKKDDTTSQDETKDDNTSVAEKKDNNTSQAEKKDANTSQDDNTQ